MGADDAARDVRRADRRALRSALRLPQDHPGARADLDVQLDSNPQWVVVRSFAKVELNGFVILNTDVSKINEYMANSPHPGKDRTEGHFGFAGHSDPVQFRNVRIKTLPDSK